MRSSSQDRGGVVAAAELDRRQLRPALTDDLDNARLSGSSDRRWRTDPGTEPSADHEGR